MKKLYETLKGFEAVGYICIFESNLNLMTNKQHIIDRFISYIKIDTQSDPDSDTTPSTEKQWNLANKLVDELEASIRQAVQPLLEGGANLPGLNLSKDGQQGKEGGLISQGYVYIGEDPESQESFDVEDEDGQRDFTTVKVFREDIEDLL